MPGARLDGVLFGECNSAVIVSFAPDREQAVRDVCALLSVPMTLLGEVAGGRLVIQDCGGGEVVGVDTERLKDAWQNGIPRAAKPC